jgi:hypothetical protein
VRIVILLSFVISCMLSAALGARLVTAGMRTRTAPEFAYGASLLLMGVGGAIRLVVHGFLGAGPEYHAWIIGAGVLRLLTLMALTWGIRAIFRPQESWSLPLTLAFWILGAAGLGVVASFPNGLAEAGMIYQLGDLANALAVGWGCAESLAYYGKMKRRLAIGLADPVTVHQFGMWGVGFTCALLASATLFVGTAALGSAITGAPAIMALVQFFLLMTAVITWVAFYPPQLLRDRFRDQATESVASLD